MNFLLLLLLLPIVPFFSSVSTAVGVSPVFENGGGSSTGSTVTGAFKQDGFTNGFVIS